MAAVVIRFQNLLLSAAKYPFRRRRYNHFPLLSASTVLVSTHSRRNSNGSFKTSASSLSAADKTLVLTKDERYSSPSSCQGDEDDADQWATIAAIVTSLGGGPAAVGIVRLSGPSAIAVAGQVFRPAGKKAGVEGFRWKPRSHFVEYGVVLDARGEVIDEGGFAALVKSLRNQCIELLTDIEARLDFDDEMPPLDPKMLVDKIDIMWLEVQKALETANYDRLLQSGLQIAIIGRPNVGKSSLLNAWSKAVRSTKREASGHDPGIA